MANKNESEIGSSMKKIARAAGSKIMYPAFALWYIMKDHRTPPWAKSIVVAALVYLVSPMDAIPDITPIIGYSDDLGVLLGALKTLDEFYSASVQKKAESKVDSIL